MVKDVSDLRVYGAAQQLGDDIWAIVAQWDWFQKQTVGGQLVRAADSIAANLAEGFGRYHYADHRRFVYMSRGSACEAVHWLEAARNRGMLEPSQATRLLESATSIGRMLSRYAMSIGPGTAGRGAGPSRRGSKPGKADVT